MPPTEIREGTELLIPVTVIETKDAGNVIVEAAGKRWLLPMASLVEYAEATRRMQETHDQATAVMRENAALTGRLAVLRGECDALIAKVIALEEAKKNAPQQTGNR